LISSRREFLTTVSLGTAGVFAAKKVHATETENLVASVSKQTDFSSVHYRAISWWLTWEDMMWPTPPLIDHIKRRADACAENAVNMCVICGSHFRWDFLPIWGRLHDLIGTIAEELHRRDIKLFDHHSAVMTHRPHNREEALDVWTRNRHHVSFYPSRDDAKNWQFNGSYLNDWRMLDVVTNYPSYITGYQCEQFCMNNPSFEAAYTTYVKRLLHETHVDGLMSDDVVYYPRWRACGCVHCREIFRSSYGHELPATSDTLFWGNLDNEAYKDWIDLRFKSPGNFLKKVRSVLPTEFPLMSCCSSSDSQAMVATGLSYQEFVPACNTVMLEMTGSSPSLAGTWIERVPSQLLHLGIAQSNNIPCIGMGYGHFKDTGFFVWAANKFLGVDCWFSTIRGRLTGTVDSLASIGDDPTLVGEGYRWEKNNSNLFRGKIESDVAVYFSKQTRNFYGQYQEDYVQDYQNTCLRLLEAKISYRVVTKLPPRDEFNIIILSSVACLSTEEKSSLKTFILSGGIVIATGPSGHRDERGRLANDAWLASFNISAQVIEPIRTHSYPPPEAQRAPSKDHSAAGMYLRIAQARLISPSLNSVDEGWVKVTLGKGLLAWSPTRFSASESSSHVISLVLKYTQTSSVILTDFPEGWQVRKYTTLNRTYVHALPTRVISELNSNLKNQFTHEGVVEHVHYRALQGKISLTGLKPFTSVIMHSPDLDNSRSGQQLNNSGVAQWSIDLSGVSRYFILECIV
jgi:hypothetical protein